MTAGNTLSNRDTWSVLTGPRTPPVVSERIRELTQLTRLSADAHPSIHIWHAWGDGWRCWICTKWIGSDPL